MNNSQKVSQRTSLDRQNGSDGNRPGGPAAMVAADRPGSQEAVQSTMTAVMITMISPRGVTVPIFLALACLVSLPGSADGMPIGFTSGENSFELHLNDGNNWEPSHYGSNLEFVDSALTEIDWWGSMEAPIVGIINDALGGSGTNYYATWVAQGLHTYHTGGPNPDWVRVHVPEEDGGYVYTGYSALGSGTGGGGPDMNTYSGQDLNLVFQVVPEPSTAALLTMGALGLFGRRRRTSAAA
ncbi:MAG: PEP-CTERM sorting domain-containing protein [Pirellulales bacterium]|nr:PEP-CTERM sorting domain-containing protein [Pirellulales bacterium]